MSLIFATQLTAIATTTLAAFAIVTAVVAYVAFRKQTQEVAILQQQTKEQQDVLAREALERRIAQAARVFIGGPRPPKRVEQTEPILVTVPYARNASDLPIYDAKLWYWPLQDFDDVGMIPPGKKISGSGRVKFRTPESAISNLILTFRDAAGFRWIRMPDGALIEQSHPTALESVQAAFESSLPTGYERQDDQITGSVADAIVVNPRSRGELRMPGDFTITDKLPPEHQITLTSEDGSTQGVYYRSRSIGPEELFTRVWDVWNNRDSRVTARMILTGQADQADTQEG